MKKYFKKLNIFILIVLFLLGFSLLYFLYSRARSQADVYVKVALYRGQSNSIPYWLNQAINVGDKELSPLGGLNVEVYDKFSFAWGGQNEMAFLLLKVNTIKDRTGIYLYKNKPLLVGGSIDLKLPKAQVSGNVIQIEDHQITDEYNKVTITVLGKGTDVWISNNLKNGSSIVDNKGRILAKVTEVKSTQLTSIGTLVRDENTNKAIMIFDNNERDIEANVDLLVRKTENYYFFGETQKVKVGEQISLPFKEVTLNAPITSIKEIK